MRTFVESTGAASVATTASGGITVIAGAAAELDTVSREVALDTLGNTLSNRVVDGALTAAGFDRDGALLVTGREAGGRAVVAKLDIETGGAAWVLRVGDDTGNFAGTSVATGHDGNLAVLGAYRVWTLGPQSEPRGGFFVAKISGAGEIFWIQKYGDLATHFEPARVAVDSMNRIVLSGFINLGELNLGGAPLRRSDTERSFVAQFDPDGSYRWSRPVGGSSLQLVEDLAIADDGRIVVGGNLLREALGSYTTSQASLASFDAEGQLLWERTFALGDDPSRDQNEGIRVALGYCGELFLVGHGSYFGAADVPQSRIVRLQLEPATGEELMRVSFGATQHVWASSLAASPGGGAVLAGHFRGSFELAGARVESQADELFVARLNP